MGVTGLVEELGKEGRREMLGRERVLEEQGVMRLLPGFQALSLNHQSPGSPPASHLQKLLSCRPLLGVLG